MKDDPSTAEPTCCEGTCIVRQLRAADDEERERLLRDYVARKAESVLRIASTPIPHDVHLMLYGMDSLLFFRLLEGMATELRINVSPDQALAGFQNLTINNLATMLNDHWGTVENKRPTGIAEALNAPLTPDHAHRYAPFPLTDIQYAYWIGQSGVIGWGNVPCHAYAEFDRTDDELDFSKLNRALQQTIQRHDMMRAVVEPNGEQRILQDVPAYKIKVVDLRDAPPSERTRSLEATRKEMVSAPQSHGWPLFEFRATRYDGNKVRFHINLDLLIFDGQSIHLLFRDLTRFYGGNETTPVPLDLSFRDYVLALHSIEKTDLYKRARKYWLDKLDTMPQPPELPMVKDMTSVSQFHFSGREFSLSPTEWKQFKQYAAQAGVTPSAALLTAYTKIIAAWNRHDSFTLNLTQYNRHPLHPEVTEILGDFTSILLVPVNNNPEDDFSTSAQCLQQEILHGMDNRHFNGIEVMRALSARQEGNTPYITPYVFTSITGVGSDIGEEGPMHIDNSPVGERSFMSIRTPQVVLDHQIREENNALFCRWDVVEELFPDGMIHDMFSAYANLLRKLSTDETAWEKRTDIPLPEHQQKARDKANDTNGKHSSELLHTLFAQKAAQQADAPAVITETLSLSYGELDIRARRLARELHEAGVGRGSMVAVLMHKGWEQVVAVLGILYAGGTYLPIDADFPEQRVLHLLENGDAAHVVTQPDHMARYHWPNGLRVFSVNADIPEADTLPPFAPVQSVDDLAYVIYTSGSTGLPKGVMIDHRGAVNTILDVNERFNVTAQDRVLALSDLNFDLSVYDIFGTLAAGGAIVIPEAARRKDPSHWTDLMLRRHVTVWNSVPALMQIFIEYTSSRPEQVLPPLRLAMLSGDWIPLDLPKHIRQQMPDIEIIGMGGATEASIWSIFYPIGDVAPTWKSSMCWTTPLPLVLIGLWAKSISAA